MVVEDKSYEQQSDSLLVTAVARFANVPSKMKAEGYAGSISTCGPRTKQRYLYAKCNSVLHLLVIDP